MVNTPYKNCNPELTVINQTDQAIMLAQVPENLVPKENADFLNDDYALMLKALLSIGSSSAISPKSNTDINVILDQKDSTQLEDLTIDLITMRTADLFPVKQTLAVPSSCEGNTTEECQGYDCHFKNLSVTSNDEKIMRSSLAFYQAMTGYPNTIEIKKLVKILENVADGQIQADKAEQKINSLFANCDEPYNLCTFDSLATVISFALIYASECADFKESYVYHVYLQNDTESDAEAVLKKIGTITFNKTKSANLGDRNAGYSIDYSSLQKSEKIPLKIHKGQFVQKEGSDLSTIVLLGSFKLKSDLTLNAADNQPMPILTGKVGNQAIVAMPLDISSSQPPSKGIPWWNVYDAKWSQILWRSLALVSSIAGLIGISYGAVKFIRSKSKKGKTATEKEAFEKEVTKALTKIVAESIGATADNLGISNEKLKPEKLSNACNEAGKQLDSLRLEAQKANYKALIDGYQAALDKFYGNSNSSTLESMQQDINEAKSELADIKSVSDLLKKQRSITDKFSDIAGGVESELPHLKLANEKVYQEVETIGEVCSELEKNINDLNEKIELYEVEDEIPVFGD